MCTWRGIECKCLAGVVGYLEEGPSVPERAVITPSYGGPWQADIAILLSTAVGLSEDFVTATTQITSWKAVILKSQKQSYSLEMRYDLVTVDLDGAQCWRGCQAQPCGCQLAPGGKPRQEPSRSRDSSGGKLLTGLLSMALFACFLGIESYYVFTCSRLGPPLHISH